MTELTISQHLARVAEKYQTKTALRFPAENLALDYRTLQEMADATAKALLGIGMQKGDHIGIWSLNASRWVLLALGAAQIGVAFVPINAAYKREELTYIVRKMDINCLLVMDSIQGKSCLDRLEGFWHNGKPDPQEVPVLRDVYALSEDPLGDLKGWDSFLEQGEAVTDEQLAQAKAQVTGKDIYSIQATSGTTAMPKGAQLYQYGVLYTAQCYAKLLHLEEEDVSCVPLPLFHCFGNVLTLLGGILSGSTTVYMESFSAREMLRFLAEEKCTCILGVPTMFTAMMAQPNFDSSRYSIKKAGMGGSYAPPALAQAITENFHCPGLVVGYGLSEAASLVTLSDIGASVEKRLSTVGCPLPDFEVSLYDPDTGRTGKELPQGEIICRGEGLMRSYYNDPEETAKALDADGWLHTGDLGSFDESGYLRVVGRIKDIIVRGGENISPSQIEALLLERPEIRDVQCVGVPDRIHGEEIAAFVILKDGATMTPQQIKDHVEVHLARYKTPKYVFFTDQFPMNAAGKVLKRDLSKMAAEMIQE